MPKHFAYRPSLCVTQSLNTGVQLGGDRVTRYLSTVNNTMRLISGCVRPTQTPWLPVLANIAPPRLRRKVATDNLLATVENHPEWPLHADIANHPAQ